jgi:hypothetical protein
MQRKDFIKSTSLGLLGAMLTPQYLAKNEVILEHNNKRYKIKPVETKRYDRNIVKEITA